MTLRFNNKKSTRGRGIQLVPRYTAKQIKQARTSIERERMARCYKNIKTTA